MFGDVFVQAARNQLLHAQPQLPFLGIDREHLSLDQLSNLHHFLGMVDALLGAQVADVNHAFNALGKLHKCAELGDAKYWSLDHGAHGKPLRHLGPRISQGLLQTERNAALSRVHRQNHRVDGLARLDQCAGTPQLFPPRHLRNVDQPLNPGLQFHECSELDHACNRAPHTLAGLVLSGHRIPGMGLQLLHAHRNAPLAGIIRYLEHLGFDRLPHREHVRRLAHTAPGDVTYVQQSVHATNVHEGTVISEAADRTAHGVTFLHLRIAALLHQAFFLFSDNAAVHHYVFFRHLELDDTAEDFLLHQLLHFGSVPCSAARGRHERSHSHVHAEPAFDHPRHRAHNGCLVRESLFERRPVFWPLDLGACELIVALRIATFDRYRHLVARCHNLTSALEGRQRQNAFALEADVEEDGVPGDNDYRAQELSAAIFAFAQMALFVLRKKIAEGFARFAGGFSIDLGLRND